VTNLVVACLSCNSARQDTLLQDWLRQVSDTSGEAVAEIARRVRNQRRRKLSAVDN